MIVGRLLSRMGCLLVCLFIRCSVTALWVLSARGGLRAEKQERRKEERFEFVCESGLWLIVV